MKMRHRHINHKSRTAPVNKYTTHRSMNVWKKEVALKSTLKMYILVFIIKKRVRNWGQKADSRCCCSLCWAERQCREGAVAPFQGALQKSLKVQGNKTLVFRKLVKFISLLLSGGRSWYRSCIPALILPSCQNSWEGAQSFKVPVI